MSIGRTMIDSKPCKLITSILPGGKAMDVLKKLREEQGIITANVNSARGMGKLTPRAYRGVGEQTEKQILTVVVDADRADEIFEYIYPEGNIDRPHGGIIYMASLRHQTTFILPDLPEEK